MSVLSANGCLTTGCAHGRRQTADDGMAFGAAAAAGGAYGGYGAGALAQSKQGGVKASKRRQAELDAQVLLQTLFIFDPILI